MTDTTNNVLDAVREFYNHLEQRLSVFPPNCIKMRTLLSEYQHISQPIIEDAWKNQQHQNWLTLARAIAADPNQSNKDFKLQVFEIKLYVNGGNVVHLPEVLEKLEGTLIEATIHNDDFENMNENGEVASDAWWMQLNEPF
jgi:hypothetical protein